MFEHKSFILIKILCEFPIGYSPLLDMGVGKMFDYTELCFRYTLLSEHVKQAVMIKLIIFMETPFGNE